MTGEARRLEMRESVRAALGDLATGRAYVLRQLFPNERKQPGSTSFHYRVMHELERRGVLKSWFRSGAAGPKLWQLVEGTSLAMILEDEQELTNLIWPGQSFAMPTNGAAGVGGDVDKDASVAQDLMVLQLLTGIGEKVIEIDARQSTIEGKVDECLAILRKLL